MIRDSIPSLLVGCLASSSFCHVCQLSSSFFKFPFGEKQRLKNPRNMRCFHTVCFVFRYFPLSDCFSTDLNHDTYERTGNCEQNNVFSEPCTPKGAVLNANGTQHFLEPPFLLQHQVFDGHAHGVHEGQHQEHGEHASNALDEAGCRRKRSKKVRTAHKGNTARWVSFFHLLHTPDLYIDKCWVHTCIGTSLDYMHMYYML